MSRALNIACPLFLAAAIGLAACATGAAPEGSYTARIDHLAADCQARGGILAPTGAQTGRPETENVCKITGEPASRIRN